MSPGRIVLALAIFAGLLFGLHAFVYARIVRDASLPPPWSRALLVALVVLALLLPSSLLAVRFLPRAVASPVTWVAMTWLGLLFFLVLALVPAEIVRAIALSRTEGAERRLFLSRAIAGAVAAIAGLLGGVSLVGALGPVAITRVRIPLAKLKPPGFRIVQLTDVHVGPTIGREFLARVVAEANACDPDVIVITGDLVDGTVAELAPLVEPLRELRARLGVFFVTGNHERYSGADAWIAHVSSLGVTVLRGARVALGGDDGIDLAGIDDPDVSGERDAAGPIGRALEGRDPSRPLVLLAHRPKAIAAAAAAGVCVQLSGHTHGGQITPFGALVKLTEPYVAGLHRHEGTWIYVSRGTGYWGPPMRLGAPAEVACIDLVPA